MRKGGQIYIECPQIQLQNLPQTAGGVILIGSGEEVKITWCWRRQVELAPSCWCMRRCRRRPLCGSAILALQPSQFQPSRSSFSMFLLSDNVDWLNYANVFSIASLLASSSSGSLSARNSERCLGCFYTSCLTLFTGSLPEHPPAVSLACPKSLCF